MIEIGFGVGLIICATALLKYVEARTKRPGLGKGESQQIEQRLVEMERRMGDLQDIVLAMDDKIQRIDKT